MNWSKWNHVGKRNSIKGQQKERQNEDSGQGGVKEKKQVQR